MFNKNEKEKYVEILNQMLEYERRKEKPGVVKITICIVGGIGSILFMGMICFSILESGFSIDSILSILLAFFSIFISIFFYFKADETSTNFYNSSYEFMKDISVTLGKIEERFGEKLNSLNDKISHLDKISTVTSEEIQYKQDDKDKLIDELMDKANLNEAQKNDYRNQLEQKEKEIEELRQNKFMFEKEAWRLRKIIQMNSLEQMRENQDKEQVRNILKKMFSKSGENNLSIKEIRILKSLGVIDNEGNMDEKLVQDLLEK